MKIVFVRLVAKTATFAILLLVVVVMALMEFASPQQFDPGKSPVWL